MKVRRATRKRRTPQGERPPAESAASPAPGKRGPGRPRKVIPDPTPKVIRSKDGRVKSQRQLIEEAERGKKIFELFRRGRTFVEIADELGVTHGTVKEGYARVSRDYFGDTKAILQREFAKTISQIDFVFGAWVDKATGYTLKQKDGSELHVPPDKDAAKICLMAVQRKIQMFAPSQHLHVDVVIPQDGTGDTNKPDAVRAAFLARQVFALTSKQQPLHKAVDPTFAQRAQIVDMPPAESTNDAEDSEEEANAGGA